MDRAQRPKYRLGNQVLVDEAAGTLVTVAKDVTTRFLAETGIVEASDLPADWKQKAPEKQKVVQVTHAVATRRGNFTPARRFEGQELIAKAEAVDSPQGVVLDMDSTEIPIYGQQEKSNHSHSNLLSVLS